MALLILWVIGMIGGLIWLFALVFSRKESAKKKDEQKSNPHVRITVKPQKTCPRCGSPVIEYSDGWECGWCGDYCHY